jgi:hypothetical protein
MRWRIPPLLGSSGTTRFSMRDDAALVSREGRVSCPWRDEGDPPIWRPPFSCPPPSPSGRARLSALGRLVVALRWPRDRGLCPLGEPSSRSEDCLRRCGKPPVLGVRRPDTVSRSGDSLPPGGDFSAGVWASGRGWGLRPRLEPRPRTDRRVGIALGNTTSTSGSGSGLGLDSGAGSREGLSDTAGFGLASRERLLPRPRSERLRGFDLASGEGPGSGLGGAGGAAGSSAPPTAWVPARAPRHPSPRAAASARSFCHP